jgi:hypothetical protein
MEQARMYATMVARQTVIREIETDGVLALKYLERKRKEEFSPRAEHQVNGFNLKELLAQYRQNVESVDWDGVSRSNTKTGLMTSPFPFMVADEKIKE